MSRKLALFFYAITFGFFGCFLIWPILKILRGGFFDVDGHFTFIYVIEVFRNVIYLEGLRNSLGIATFSTLAALTLAMPMAFLVDRYQFWGKKLFSGLVLLPIMLPPFVGAIGLKQIFGQNGVLNAILKDLGALGADSTIDWLGNGRLWGVVLLNALSLYPILYLNIVASLANIDPAMEEAAQNLGCRGLKRFFKITLPLMRPGLFAGCTIVFIWAFTELGVPLIFDYSRTTSVQIYHGIKDIGGNPFPYALVTVMLFFSVLMYAVGKGLFGRTTFSMMAKASHVPEPRCLGIGGNCLCWAFFLSVIGLALLPHLAVVLISFSSDWYGTLLPTGWNLGNYEIALGHSFTVPAIYNSLIYSGFATLLNIFLGVAIAYVVVRTKLPGRAVLDSLAMLPLAIPGLVMAFGYLAMSREGQFFEFLNPTQNPTGLLIIAYAVRKLPFLVRSAVAGLQQTSGVYEEAAQSLGSSPLKAVIRITLPLIMANLMAGGLLAFSQSMLEVSDSLFLAQRQDDYPITKAIYELMSLLGDGRYIASALGVWSMIFLSITVIGSSVLMGRKLGSIFKV